MDDVVVAPYTATVSDSLLAITRLRLANEGSGKSNIEGLLKKLSSLKIDIAKITLNAPLKSQRKHIKTAKKPPLETLSKNDNLKKRITVTAWGFLRNHNNKPSEEVYSALISKQIKDIVLNDTNNVQVVTKNHAEDINYEGSGYQHSKSLCGSTDADTLYSGYLDITDVWQHPEITWYSYDCSTGKRIYKLYTIELSRNDAVGFKYETDLRRTFLDFLRGQL